MEKFVLLTRGRTGSTAIINELGKCRDIIATQELFQRNSFTEDVLKRNFRLLPPFDLWKQPVVGWRKVIPKYYSEVLQAHRYLKAAENMAIIQGAKVFSWKILSHHFEQRPFLCELLKERGYRAVYLKRNSVHQVLSGMIANKRGIFNSVEKVIDAQSYHIDLEDFKSLVQWERQSVKSDRSWLIRDGFDFIEVHYEDYCDNRECFYEPIFKFLHFPMETPPPSDFVKVIENLESVIKNYDEVMSVADSLREGM